MQNLGALAAMGKLYTSLITCFLLAIACSLTIVSASPSWQLTGAIEQATPSPRILVKVYDAFSGAPIENATVILWNLNIPEKPRVGAGIYFTNKDGFCLISGEYLRPGYIYRLYAYKGNFEENFVEYVPAKYEKDIYMGKESINLTLALVPGASIILEEAVYIVQSSTPEERYVAVKVIPEAPTPSSLIMEYGASPDIFYLGLSRKVVIVPANIPFKLEAEVFYFSKESVSIEKEIFYMDNNSMPFVLPQSSIISLKVPAYSLRRSLDYIRSVWLKTSSLIDEAQKVGFTVFSERQILMSASGKISEAESLLFKASKKEDFEGVWLLLRKVLGELNYILAIISMKYFAGKTNAVYLSWMMAIFSVVIGSFFFENNKRKIALSIASYLLLTYILYLVHPGAHVIIGENIRLFMQSAVTSLLVILAIVFGVPRVWKERSIEGEVSWRSALSIIFSMSKRQIRRKRLRSFLTMLSICIFILAFTSLTSFGTVYEIVSDKVNASPPSNGILIKRLNTSSGIFMPLGLGDIDILPKIVPALNVTVRLKNMPKYDSIVRIVNPKTNDAWLIYGVIAVQPAIEKLYTKLHETVIDGLYLSSEGCNEILIDKNVAEKLNVKVGSNVTLEIIGVGVTFSAIVRGLFDGEKYTALVDLNGEPLSPLRYLKDGSIRKCNGSEVIVTNLSTAMKIQELIDLRYITRAPRFLVPSEIVFRPSKEQNIEDVARTIILFFNYDVFVAEDGRITYYHIGSYFEVKGLVELMIPLVMVILNVSMVMINSIYERREEIKVLSMIGLNPTHIALTFLAEAVVMGMVSGSVGYVFGLGFYRITTFLSQSMIVREKLEWWWSALGFTLAIVLSIIASIRPAAMAIRVYTPSKIKKLKISEAERKKRKEEIFKVYQAREISMPVKLLPAEKTFFINYFLTSLKEISTSLIERTENIELLPEVEDVKGRIISTIRFDYYLGTPERRVRIRSKLLVTKSPSEEYYRVLLSLEPEPGIPESMVDRVVDFVNDVIMYWVRNKKRIIGGSS